MPCTAFGFETLCFNQQNGQLTWQFSDIYTSTDVIFMDERLTAPYRGWQAGFSNIFDDHLFNGQTYEFTVEARMRSEKMNREVVVELQSISEALYYYLKSVMVYRITEQDSYTEAIQFHSNVDGGLGIVGALSGEKHHLPFRNSP